MSYLDTIKTAIIVFPIIAFVFTFPFILHQYHKYGSINSFRVLIIYSFILYMMVIYFLVILPLPNKTSITKPISEMINLVPFSFISDFIKESSFVLTDPKTYFKAITEPCVYTVVFNIFMTIPFGMYLRYYFKCNLKKTIVFSFLLSLFFEVTQLTGLYFIYSSPYRLFDVNDLIMNTLGGFFGYHLMGFVENYLPTRKEIDEKALKKGNKVSGLRRITVFCLDFLVFLTISLLIAMFFNNDYMIIVVFIVYYILIPYLLNGKTFGGSFLNVRLIFSNYKFLNMTFRILFLYFYYFVLPIVFMFGSFLFNRYFNLNGTQSIWIYLMVLFIIIIFYLSHLLIIVKNKKIYYDKFFKVSYESTIISD